MLTAVSFVFSSCSIGDEPNFFFLPLQIVSVELPESFVLNETFQIEVTYNQPDGCTSFAGFDVNDEALTVRNVVVLGSTRTDQEACTQQVVEQTSSFDFVVNYEQPYTFRFWQGENENGEQQYLEVIVPVN